MTVTDALSSVPSPPLLQKSSRYVGLSTLNERQPEFSRLSFVRCVPRLYGALDVAKENLLALPVKFIGAELDEGVYLSATGDSYDASRLILIDPIRRFPVKGEHIAMIPNRENLIVTGSEDVEGLAGMVKLAKKALNDPRLMSGIALRLDGDEWTPWLPPPSHPSYKDFQVLRRQTLGKDYADQKELLDKLYEKKGA